VPSVIPAALERVAADLRCPVCARPLAATGRTLRCARAHSFDPSRHGFVILTAPRRRRAAGDDAAMVAARAAVLDAKHFAPLTGALVATAVQATAQDAPLVLDAGAGTGHHLAAVLGALPNAGGVAFDASRAALRQAACTEWSADSPDLPRARAPHRAVVPVETADDAAPVLHRAEAAAEEEQGGRAARGVDGVESSVCGRNRELS